MTTMMKPATLEEARLALIRAHDALASVNKSGAYRDILSDMREALCSLSDEIKRGGVNDVR